MSNRIVPRRVCQDLTKYGKLKTKDELPERKIIQIIRNKLWEIILAESAPVHYLYL